MKARAGRAQHLERPTSEQHAVAKALEPAEQRVLLRGLSWDTYERILADNEARSVPRLAFDQGVLEAMSPSTEHEVLGRNIGFLVGLLAAELGIDVVDVGSTTFRRADLQRGFEPDACFYVQNAARIRGKTRIDLTVDPPPDLVIEVDITNSSLNKLPIYAQIGVLEVWRHDGQRLVIFRLESRQYVEAAASGVLPPVTGADLSSLVEQGTRLTRPVWMRNVREWAREAREARDRPV